MYSCVKPADGPVWLALFLAVVVLLWFGTSAVTWLAARWGPKKKSREVVSVVRDR